MVKLEFGTIGEKSFSFTAEQPEKLASAISLMLGVNISEDYFKVSPERPKAGWSNSSYWLDCVFYY